MKQNGKLGSLVTLVPCHVLAQWPLVALAAVLGADGLPPPLLSSLAATFSPFSQATSRESLVLRAISRPCLLFRGSSVKGPPFPWEPWLAIHCRRGWARCVSTHKSGLTVTYVIFCPWSSWGLVHQEESQAKTHPSNCPALGLYPPFPPSSHDQARLTDRQPQTHGLLQLACMWDPLNLTSHLQNPEPLRG